MAGEAKRVPWLLQVRHVVIAMHIMAVKASQLAVIHIALHEVIALHAIFVCRHVRKLKEVRPSRLHFLELPEVCQLHPHLETNRPVVMLAIDRVSQRTPLAMALDACIVATYPVQCLWVHDVLLRRMRYMQAPRPMAPFAADVPLRYGLGLNVIVHRVAAIARWPGGTVEVRRPIEIRPPVRSFLHVIREPFFLRDVPLCG